MELHEPDSELDGLTWYKAV